jgi:hypothetical protein
MNARKNKTTKIGKIGRYFSQSKNAYKYAYGNNKKLGNYDRHENQATATMTSERV